MWEEFILDSKNNLGCLYEVQQEMFVLTLFCMAENVYDSNLEQV